MPGLPYLRLLSRYHQTEWHCPCVPRFCHPSESCCCLSGLLSHPVSSRLFPHEGTYFLPDHRQTSCGSILPVFHRCPAGTLRSLPSHNHHVWQTLRLPYHPVPALQSYGYTDTLILLLHTGLQLPYYSRHSEAQEGTTFLHNEMQRSIPAYPDIQHLTLCPNSE